jgi:ankyrin repeat protein
MIEQKDELSSLVQIKRPEGFDVREVCQTALHTAVFNNRHSTLKLLLAAGADVKKVDAEGATPLMLAIRLGLVDMIEDLMKNGSSLVVMDRRGLTALTQAARTNSYEMLRAVLGRGVPLDTADGHEGTMLHYA